MVVAPLKPRGMHPPHPVHVAVVTVAHGRLEAPMDRIGCLLLRACGPNGVLPGPPGSTSRARSPREACLLPHCRRIAALPWRAGEPCGRPVVAAFGQAHPRGRRGIGYGQSALRSPGVVPGSRSARLPPRRRPPSPPVRFVSHGTCRVFTRRSLVRVPRRRHALSVSLKVARDWAMRSWSLVATSSSRARSTMRRH